MTELERERGEQRWGDGPKFCAAVSDVRLRSAVAQQLDSGSLARIQTYGTMCHIILQC